MNRILSLLLLAILLSVSSMVQTSIRGYNVEHTIIFDTIFDIENDLGLDHMSASTNNNISVSESSLNVMYSGKRSRSSLGGCDKYVDYHRND